MRTLCDLLRNSVVDPARSEGEALHREKRVTILEVNRWTVRARVGEGESFETQIEIESRHVLYCACSCPVSQKEGDLCAHLWATLLAIDEGRRLPAARILRGNVAIYTPRRDGGDGDKGGEDGDGLDVESEALADQDIAKAFEQIGLPRKAAEEFFSALEGPKRPSSGARPRSKAAAPKVPPWKLALSGIRNLERQGPIVTPQRARTETRLHFVLEMDPTQDSGSAVLGLYTSIQKPHGDWGPRKPLKLRYGEEPGLDLSIEEQCLLSQVLKAGRSGYWSSYRTVKRHQLRLNRHSGPLLRHLAGRGRLEVGDGAGGEKPLLLDPGPAWEFRLRLAPDQEGKHWLLRGVLQREGEELDPAEPEVLLAGTGVIHRGRLAALEDHGGSAWIEQLRRESAITVPRQAKRQLLELLGSFSRLPPIDWPESLGIEIERAAPVPQVRFLAPRKRDLRKRPPLCVEVGFHYGDTFVRSRSEGALLWDREKRRLVPRQAEQEADALSTLQELGCKLPSGLEYAREAVREGSSESLHDLELRPTLLGGVVRELVAQGWRVEAEGQLYRQASRIDIQVRSGIDWFDLEGRVDFGGEEVPLPKLLEALRRGESTVVLGDGSQGVLPEAWLRRHGLLAALGERQGESVRFRRTQLGILDALLSEEKGARWDETFAEARRRLQGASAIEPADAPAGFGTELRPYQRDGLGWLEFLRRVGFGGCLADDMGLGKTVQVLAFLERLRQEREADSGAAAPSLVVVPRSLVFNWQAEAKRFAPRLRILDHTGSARAERWAEHASADVVLTTYGTLRRDIELLRTVHFHYAILDEAQAIKNAQSDSARAARLLQAEHRLALSGTPVENHLGELHSLFEFLNPGMLGRAAAFERARGNGAKASDEAVAVLAKALRPFILRRTKLEVAKDLPPRLEQTILCQLSGAERRHYDELREHYRANLLAGAKAEGLGKAKIQVLEALLRLRQAACHPGLLDQKLRDGSSTKLDLLLQRLEEVRAEGHKALVFSQFTTLLGLFRTRLDAQKIPYEYLDGRTQDRKSKVERFQSDPGCGIFLISLKAGGLGLNLTAAEYVFLLDPWWNPAAEAQAIDRAHRIGQDRQVFAYRLIARDTVEERVLELQERKKRLADAILAGNGGILRELTVEDLDRLLS